MHRRPRGPAAVPGRLGPSVRGLNLQETSHCFVAHGALQRENGVQVGRRSGRLRWTLLPGGIGPLDVRNRLRPAAPVHHERRRIAAPDRDRERAPP